MGEDIEIKIRNWKHRMELTRTLISVMVLCLQLVILFKLFN